MSDNYRRVSGSPKRLARIRISEAIFRAGVVTGSHVNGFTVARGFRPDVRILEAHFDHAMGCVDLLMESGGFDEVAPGDLIPILNVECVTDELAKQADLDA